MLNGRPRRTRTRTSLSVHLVEVGEHGRLGFHPECAMCRRERLLGALSAEPPVSRRVAAALATGLLAFAAAAPGIAAAQEVERQSEGTVAPEESTVGELDDPSFDPGGETALPFETGPVQPTPMADDSAPLETEPLDDPAARLAPLAEAEPEPGATDAPVLLGEAPPAPDGEGAEATAAPEVITVPPQPEAALPNTNTGAPAPQAERTEPVRDRRPQHSPDMPSNRPGSGSPATNQTGPVATSEPVAPQPPVTGSSPAAAHADSTVAPEPAAAPASNSGSHVQPIPSDLRFYLVAPGDSLWSIAERLLGANASSAEIAREVDRLWRLNDDRIGTGDPDVLPVGTRLRLR